MHLLTYMAMISDSKVLVGKGQQVSILEKIWAEDGDCGKGGERGTVRICPCGPDWPNQ